MNVTEVEELALTPLLLTKSPENLYAPQISGDLRMDRGGPSSASSKRVAVMSVGRSSRTVSVPPSARNSVCAVIGPGSFPSRASVGFLRKMKMVDAWPRNTPPVRVPISVSAVAVPRRLPAGHDWASRWAGEQDSVRPSWSMLIDTPGGKWTRADFVGSSSLACETTEVSAMNESGLFVGLMVTAIFGA